MNRPREEFIAQFAIPFHVHCLKLWSRRASAPPYSVARCCFEWISSTNGTVSLRAHDFAIIVRPVIDELTAPRRKANDPTRTTSRRGFTTRCTPQEPMLRSSSPCRRTVSHLQKLPAPIDLASRWCGQCRIHHGGSVKFWRREIFFPANEPISPIRVVRCRFASYPARLPRPPVPRWVHGRGGLRGPCQQGAAPQVLLFAALPDPPG